MEIKSNVKLTKWQRETINGILKHPTSSISVVKAKRQVGKSIMIEMLLLYYAINKKRSVSICISPTLKQSNKILKELDDAVKHLPIYAGINQVKMIIHFTNGSSIMFASAEQRDALRGFTASGILCIDECAYIPDDILFDMFPFADVHKAPIVLTSTPRFKTGAFYDYFMRGVEGEPNIYSYDWSKYDTSIFLPPDKLETYRKSLPKMKFTTEYLGEFVDASGGVFGEFSECISSTLTTTDGYCMGIDWASTGSDSTSVTIFNKDHQMIHLEYWSEGDESYTIDRIIKIIEKYRPKKIQVETNSIGQIYYSLLQKRINQLNINTSLKGFNTNNTSKQKIVNKFQVALQNNSVTILDEPTLIKQMTMFEAKLTPSGKVTYEAARGQHDDVVMSTLLAYDCFNSGNYSIS